MELADYLFTEKAVKKAVEKSDDLISLIAEILVANHKDLIIGHGEARAVYKLGAVNTVAGKQDLALKCFFSNALFSNPKRTFEEELFLYNYLSKEGYPVPSFSLLVEVEYKEKKLYAQLTEDLTHNKQFDVVEMKNFYNYDFKNHHQLLEQFFLNWIHPKLDFLIEQIPDISVFVQSNIEKKGSLVIGDAKHLVRCNHISNLDLNKIENEFYADRNNSKESYLIKV